MVLAAQNTKNGIKKKAINILKKKERHLMMSFPDLPKPDRKVRLAANIIKKTTLILNLTIQ